LKGSLKLLFFVPDGRIDEWKINFSKQNDQAYWREENIERMLILFAKDWYSKKENHYCVFAPCVKDCLSVLVFLYSVATKEFS
jgi:hypothetical protein